LHLDDRTRIRHAIDATEKAIEFTARTTREDLAHDEPLALALVHLLEIVGEASRHVSPGTQKVHPEVPWRDVIAARNRPSHGYFDINYDVIWDTVQDDLPGLVEALSRVLAELR
jgi:uncharacterized protein with HEPN domain